MFKKVLITGFEAFGELDVNPSKSLIEALQEESYQSVFRSKRIHLTAAVLSVEYSRAFLEFKKLVDEHEPQIALSFGVAQKRNEICLEKIAINHKSKVLKDNSGHAPVENKILSSGPDGIFSNIEDLDGHALKLKEKGWRVKTSFTAGEYVCNALMYESCLYAKKKGFLYDFIHIPNVNLEQVLNDEKKQALPYFIFDMLELLK